MKKNGILILFAAALSCLLISCGSKPAASEEKKEAPAIVLTDFFIAANDADYSDNIEKIKSIKTGSANKYRIYFVVEDSDLDVKNFYTSFDNFADPAKSTVRPASKQTQEKDWFCWQNVYFEGYAGAATFYAYADDAKGNKSKVVTYSISLDSEKESSDASDSK